MTEAPPDFDPSRHKEAARNEWDAAAEGWRRWEPMIAAWMADATEVMLDMARIAAGDHVLDVAAGAGDQSLKAAARVGPQGSVLATDISERMCACVREAAQAAGLDNVVTQVGAAEDLELDMASLDAAICRLGLMLFADPHGALEVMYRALRPGGRVAAVVFTTPEASPFLSMPMRIVLQRTGQPAPGPGQPGLFALGASGVLEDLFATAGFQDAQMRRLGLQVRLASARDAANFLQQAGGAYRQRVKTLPEEQRSAVWQEIEEAYRAYEGDRGLVMATEVLIGAARRP